MWVCPAVHYYPLSCLCLALCPLPSPKQGNSLTFLLFSQGYSQYSILGHISSLKFRLWAPRRQGTATVARYCFSLVISWHYNQVINGFDSDYCLKTRFFHGALSLYAWLLNNCVVSNQKIKTLKSG